MEYEELLEQLEKVTDPANLTEEKFVSMMNSELLMALCTLRSATFAIRRMIEDKMAPAHREICKEEYEANLLKIEKTTRLLLRDAVRSTERLNRCTCEYCRENAAPFN